MPKDCPITNDYQEWLPVHFEDGLHAMDVQILLGVDSRHANQHFFELVVVSINKQLDVSSRVRKRVQFGQVVARRVEPFDDVGLRKWLDGWSLELWSWSCLLRSFRAVLAASVADATRIFAFEQLLELYIDEPFPQILAPGDVIFSRGLLIFIGVVIALLFSSPSGNESPQLHEQLT